MVNESGGVLCLATLAEIVRGRPERGAWVPCKCSQCLSVRPIRSDSKNYSDTIQGQASLSLYYFNNSFTGILELTEFTGIALSGFVTHNAHYNRGTITIGTISIAAPSLLV